VSCAENQPLQIRCGAAILKAGKQRPEGDCAMLDERDLQAISELIDGKLAASEERMKQYVDLIIENEVRPNFRLLAEGHKTLLETLAPKTALTSWRKRSAF